MSVGSVVESRKMVLVLFYSISSYCFHLMAMFHVCDSFWVFFISDGLICSGCVKETYISFTSSLFLKVASNLEVFMMSTLLLLRLFAELLLCFRISFARLALLFFLQLFFIFYVSGSQLGNYICTTLLYSL